MREPVNRKTRTKAHARLFFMGGGNTRPFAARTSSLASPCTNPHASLLSRRRRSSQAACHSPKCLRACSGFAWTPPHTHQPA